MIVVVAGPEGGTSDEAFHEVERVVVECGCGAGVERVTEFDRIVALGVYAVPGIVVDGMLRSIGRVPPRDEIACWLIREKS